MVWIYWEGNAPIHSHFPPQLLRGLTDFGVETSYQSLGRNTFVPSCLQRTFQCSQLRTSIGKPTQADVHFCTSITDRPLRVISHPNEVYYSTHMLFLDSIHLRSVFLLFFFYRHSSLTLFPSFSFQSLCPEGSTTSKVFFQMAFFSQILILFFHFPIGFSQVHSDCISFTHLIFTFHPFLINNL